MKIKGLILFLFLMPLSLMAQDFSATAIPDSVWALMQGKSVPKNCTVGRNELRYLRVMHIGKDGKAGVNGRVEAVLLH